MKKTLIITWKHGVALLCRLSGEKSLRTTYIPHCLSPQAINNTSMGKEQSKEQRIRQEHNIKEHQKLEIDYCFLNLAEFDCHALHCAANITYH